jgi:uracil phosphoribosyltransferase
MDNNIFVLNETHSVANHFLAELRDITVQKNRMLFRKNMERLGEVLAYELSKSLPYEIRNIKTPLGNSEVAVLKQHPLLIAILRAGIPFLQGFMNVFDHADCGFIGAYRNENSGKISVSVDYLSIPPIDGKTIILIDPMLATGRSVLDAVKGLLSKGTPEQIHIVSAVASPEGLKLLKENLTLRYSLWTCAIDEKLDSSFYIVPGLGDAGDLSYGIKESG